MARRQPVGIVEQGNFLLCFVGKAHHRRACPQAKVGSEVLQRDNQRTGRTTRSIPSKKKLSYYLDSRLVPVD